jgi:hypothetical protein
MKFSEMVYQQIDKLKGKLKSLECRVLELEKMFEGVVHFNGVKMEPVNSPAALNIDESKPTKEESDRQLAELLATRGFQRNADDVSKPLKALSWINESQGDGYGIPSPKLTEEELDRPPSNVCIIQCSKFECFACHGVHKTQVLNRSASDIGIPIDMEWWWTVCPTTNKSMHFEVSSSWRFSVREGKPFKRWMLLSVSGVYSLAKHYEYPEGTEIFGIMQNDGRFTKWRELPNVSNSVEAIEAPKEDAPLWCEIANDAIIQCPKFECFACGETHTGQHMNRLATIVEGSFLENREGWKTTCPNTGGELRFTVGEQWKTKQDEVWSLESLTLLSNTMRFDAKPPFIMKDDGYFLDLGQGERRTSWKERIWDKLYCEFECPACDGLHKTQVLERSTVLDNVFPTDMEWWRTVCSVTKNHMLFHVNSGWRCRAYPKESAEQIRNRRKWTLKFIGSTDQFVTTGEDGLPKGVEIYGIMQDDGRFTKWKHHQNVTNSVEAEDDGKFKCWQVEATEEDVISAAKEVAEIPPGMAPVEGSSEEEPKPIVVKFREFL